MKESQITKRGFTLLEILLVIAAIGILAAIVIVAINPQRQLAQVRNTDRQSDVNTIQKALDQYLIDNGSYPTGISIYYQDICTESIIADCLDLSELSPRYLASIPQDPTGESYQVALSSTNGRVSVNATQAELNQEIAVNLVSFPYLSSIDGGDAAAVYSLRKAYETYQGSAIRVVRSSDSAQLDIGFVGDDLDTQALLDFAGAGNATVRTWYDQSGNGRNVTQTVTSSQPRIVNAGVVEVSANGSIALRFQASLLSLASALSLPARYVGAVAQYNSGGDNAPVVLHTGSINGLMGFSSSGPSIRWRVRQPDTAATQATTNSAGEPVLMAYSGSSFASINMYKNGELVRTDTGATNFNSVIGLGGFHSTQTLNNGFIQEIVIYPSDKSDLRTDIESNINNYYGIY